MARNDITIKETGGLNSVPTDRWTVAAGRTPAGDNITIKAGEPAKLSASAATLAVGTSLVVCLVDADLTIATDQPMAGIAAIDSTESVSAVGYSDQYVPLPGIKWEIKAKTASTVDTRAEIDKLIGALYLIDLSGTTTSSFTIDAGTTASTAAFLMVGGDPTRSTIHFRIRPDACAYGRATV